MIIEFRSEVSFLVVLMLVFAPAPFRLSQRRTHKSLEQRIPSFVALQEDMAKVLGNLASTYKSPIGLELIPSGGGLQAEDKISVKVEGGTLREVLDAVVKADPRYEWQQVDDVINVFPRAVRSPILETEVNAFELDQATILDASLAVTELPEVKAKIQQMGLQRRDFLSISGSVPDRLSRLSVSLHKITARRILNELLKASDSTYWVFFRYGDHNQYFSIGWP
jgi:hypothetical protein